MAFPLSHWKHPRATIASRFESNDIEYATHGALQSMLVLQHLGLKVSDLAGKTILDYGCGTGRIARPLCAVFGKVYAYDPVPECIEVGKAECAGITFNNLVMTSNLVDIPEVDFAFSVNVIEHLLAPEAQVMIDNLTRLVRGKTVLWHSVSKNRHVLAPYTTDAATGTIQISTIAFRNRDGL